MDAVQTERLEEVDKDNVYEYRKERETILKDTVVTDLRDTWITSNYDFELVGETEEDTELLPITDEKLLEEVYNSFVEAMECDDEDGCDCGCHCHEDGEECHCHDDGEECDCDGECHCHKD